MRCEDRSEWHSYKPHHPLAQSILAGCILRVIQLDKYGQPTG